MVNYYKIIKLKMKTLKKASYLIFALCVLHCHSTMVECAISGSGASSSSSSSSSKTAYARTVDKGQGSSSSILDSIYHKSRQSRCVTCYEDRRYGDDRSRYYGSYAARSGDDRTSSWYYPSYDRYDDRGYRGSEYDRYGADRYGADRYGADRYGADRYGADRYGADRYGADRYGADRYGSTDRYAGYSKDDRYAARPPYDRYDTRTRGGAYERPVGYERGESRGYGYDNRDRYYGDYYGRDRYYDRPKYAAAGTSSYGGYDRDYYDRYSPRYDSTSGAPYYHGKQKPQEDRHYLPEPYDYHSPCGVRKPNCPYNPQEEGTRVTSGTIDSGYSMGVSQTTYNTNSHGDRNESSKGSGANGGWSYMREDDQNPSRGGSSNSGGSSSDSNNNNNRDRDRSRDQQSSAYGALLDRGSNLIGVEPVKTDENANNSDKQQANGDASPSTDKQNENGQNS